MSAVRLNIFDRAAFMKGLLVARQTVEQRRDRAARPAPPSGPEWPTWVSFPLALLGLAVSIYLTVKHFQHAPLAGCSESGTVNCTKVTTSPQSEIFGHIPVAVTGLAYYVVMAALTSPWAWRSVNPWFARLRLAAAVSGIGMVAYLVYVEVVQLKAICLYCTGVHVITFLLFITILAAYLLRPLDQIES